MVHVTSILLAFPLAIGEVPANGMALGKGHDDSDPDRQLLEFSLKAHRASRDLIQTASCRVDFELFQEPRVGGPVHQSCSGRYWFSHEAIRLQVTDTEHGKVDYVWKDSVRKYVVRRQANGQEQVGADLGSFPERFQHRCDAWARGLLALNVPNEVYYVRIEELVEKATRLESVKRISVQGKEIIALRLFFDKKKERSSPWDVEIHLDPAFNYLISRASYAQSKGNNRREEQITEFLECAPGVFFPGRARGSHRDGGTSTTRFSEVRINEPLPNDIFHLRYPNGVILSDTIRGERYRVDPEGNQISAATPLYRGPAPPPLADAPPTHMGTETESERFGIGTWIIVISVGVLVIAGALLLYRRWRAARSV
jgi:hypothetical protein